MQTNGSGPTLLSLIGRLSLADQDRREMARALVGELNKVDWLLLASWDAAASFTPAPGNLRLVGGTGIEIQRAVDKPLVKLRLRGPEDADRNQPGISYEGTRWSVVAAGDSLLEPTMHLRHDPTVLLGCMEFIRNRLDDIVPLPAQMRLARLKEEADYWGIDVDDLRTLSLWWPEVDKHIQEMLTGS